MNKKTCKSQKPPAFRRKLLAVSTAVLAGVPALCSALGLGEIQYKSYLGEPLSAEIDLVNLPGDINRENLKFRQVDRAEAEQLGVEIISNWHRFNFEMDPSKPNYQVKLNSNSPIKEPYINILVELSWPKGTLYREYTVFLDPAPVVPQTATRPVKIESKQTSASTEVLKDLAVGDKQYRVASGDTLYGIAQAMNVGSGTNLNQAVNWLFNNNPQAFVDGDINRLIAGKELRLPENAVLASSSSVANSVKSESLEGRVILDQPTKVEGKNELELLAKSAESGLQEQLSASRAVLDYLVKENRDLKDRLSYLEGSDYLNTLKELVDLQKNEIADLRAQLVSNVVPAADIKIPDATLASAEVQQPGESSTAFSHASFASINNPFESGRNNSQNLWAFLTSGFAIALAALLAIIVWRTRSRPLTPVKAGANKDELASDQKPPSFVFKDGKKEISIDDYLDIDVALAQKDVLNKVEELASNDFSIVDEEINQQVIVKPSLIQEPEPVVSLRDISEKVHQERSKVEYLQERIREKTVQYNERKKDEKEEPNQVEEIEIDSEMEHFLKF